MIDAGEAPWTSWFTGKDFTSDLTSGHFSRWHQLFQSRRDEPMRILEVGSWEGRSAVFFAEYFPHGSVTCIDTFAGGPVAHYGAMVDEIASVEARFDENVRPYGSRVRKLKTTSILGLGALQAEGQNFDLIYLDGDHRRDNVLAESLIAWPMLADQGFLIWDDYKAGRGLPIEERVRQAADLFLWLRAGEFDELARGAQLIIRKRRNTKRMWRRRASLLYRNIRNMLR